MGRQAAKSLSDAAERISRLATTIRGILAPNPEAGTEVSHHPQSSKYHVDEETVLILENIPINSLGA